ncbi:MAG: bifunctional diguanylate cyclase/phosphodiesterase [Pseudomonadota bacterium]
MSALVSSRLDQLPVLDERIARNGSAGLLVVQLRNVDQLRSNYGYRVTEQIIDIVEARCRGAIRSNDQLWRLTDTSFALAISPLPGDGLLLLAANKLRTITTEPIAIGNERILSKLHIGIASAPQHGKDADTLLQHAGIAALAATSDKRDVICFEADLANQARSELWLEHELDQAIACRNFQVYYQPKVSAGQHCLIGAEALVRWEHAERGWIAPDLFIPLAERANRIAPLTEYVLQSALHHASSWPECVSVSVNISPRLLGGTELVDVVRSALGVWGVAPARLTLEVTESAIMTDPEMALDALADLRKIGVRISIDDFGTGYSSLAYFKKLPADELKVDRSFVMNIFNDVGDQRIVRTIITLAKEFGLQVTAEGIEEARTANQLAEMGCDLLQGYYFGRPQPHADFRATLNLPAEPAA